MLDLAIKNIFRQKTRTALTVIGITIGIAAIIALGSIAEGLNESIKKELEFVGGIITVVSEDASPFLIGYLGSEITQDMVDDIADMSGVEETIPYALQTGRIVPGVGPEFMVIGLEPEKQNYFENRGIELDTGRILENDDEFAVVVGFQYAESNRLEAGDFIELENEDFEVVGIFKEVGTTDDRIILMSLGTMMDVYNLDTYTAVFVIPEDISKVETLADDIEDEFGTLRTETSKDIAQQASTIVSQVRIFTFGIAGISAIVGGLGVMNTMIMSVLERRREIGVLRAIGATRRFILSQILIESIVISLVGGLIGLGFGFLGNQALSLYGGESFAGYATITPELAIGGILFALTLGLVGGLYPALKATQLDPIEALRYE